VNKTKLAIDINQFIVSVVVWWKNGNHIAEKIKEIPVLFIVAGVEQVGSSSNASDFVQEVAGF
jgi:hypothetical protein